MNPSPGWEENQAGCQFYVTPFPITCQMKVMSEAHKAGTALCEERIVLGSILRCNGAENSGNESVIEIFPFMTTCYLVSVYLISQASLHTFAVTRLF